MWTQYLEEWEALDDLRVAARYGYFCHWNSALKDDEWPFWLSGSRGGKRGVIGEGVPAPAETGQS